MAASTVVNTPDDGRRKRPTHVEYTPRSAHSLPADSPTSQQLQQDRKPQAVKTQSDLLTMGVKKPETCWGTIDYQ